MDIGSVFLLLALLILVGLFIGRPLFERKAISINPAEHELSSLMAERDRILDALQELDFDYTLGKIPEADYSAQRASLLQRGAKILRQLDEFSAEAASEEAEARLESAIAARRAGVARRTKAGSPRQASLTGDGTGTRLGQAATTATTGVPDEELEALIAARRRARHDKSAGFCPQCGRAVQKSDRFCPNCGAALS